MKFIFYHYFNLTNDDTEIVIQESKERFKLIFYSREKHLVNSNRLTRKKVDSSDLVLISH